MTVTFVRRPIRGRLLRSDMWVDRVHRRRFTEECLPHGTRSSTRRLLLALVTTLLIGACGGNPASRTPGLVAHDNAQWAGIADHTRTHGDDCVADINHDGHLDVLLNAHTDQWQLLYGSASGKFTLAMRIPLHDRHGCAVADFNGDGLLDIYFAIGDCKGRICRNPKELWIQRPNQTFVDEAAQWGSPIPEGGDGCRSS